MNEDKLRIKELEEELKARDKTIYKLKNAIKTKELEYKELIKKYTNQNNELIMLKTELKGGKE